MTRLVLVVCLIFLRSAFSQDAQLFYQKGLDAIKSNQYEEAIKNFDEAIKLKKDEPVIWYNRGIVKSWLRRYEEAIEDFDQAIILNPAHKKAYNSRANCKQDITEYESAFEDYNSAIRLDSQYIDAIYNRAELYQLLGDFEKACIDFNLTYKLGDQESKRNVERCRDTSSFKGLHSILKLTVRAENDKYGFTPEYPVKVGTGSKGGPANQRAYLDLLRDAKGNPIEYARLGGCCPYQSKNAPLEMAMVDKYEIKYFDKNDKEQISVVYISFYDYEEPKILSGFSTISKRK